MVRKKFRLSNAISDTGMRINVNKAKVMAIEEECLNITWEKIGSKGLNVWKLGRLGCNCKPTIRVVMLL